MRPAPIFFSACLVLQTVILCPPVLRAGEITFSPHTFTIPEGYTLKRVAAPPLVQRPIHMCF
ncbi:MAG: hypothetical protein QGG01_08830, partial [Roseibacillus sp.]|nr:hypothetical protein [Roseibacillus sp.]